MFSLEVTRLFVVNSKRAKVVPKSQSLHTEMQDGREAKSRLMVLEISSRPVGAYATKSEIRFIKWNKLKKKRA